MAPAVDLEFCIEVVFLTSQLSVFRRLYQGEYNYFASLIVSKTSTLFVNLLDKHGIWSVKQKSKLTQSSNYIYCNTQTISQTIKQQTTVIADAMKTFKIQATKISDGRPLEW